MSSATLPMVSVGQGHFESRSAVRSIPLLPRNAVLSLLHGYRATISRAYGDVCKFYPSCSAYAVGSIQQHGVLKGAGLAAGRIARCHPWAAGGVDDVPLHKNFRYELTPRGFVVPVSLRKD